VKFLAHKEYTLGSSFAVFCTMLHIHLASGGIQDYLISHCDY